MVQRMHRVHRTPRPPHAGRSSRHTDALHTFDLVREHVDAPRRLAQTGLQDRFEPREPRADRPERAERQDRPEGGRPNRERREDRGHGEGGKPRGKDGFKKGGKPQHNKPATFSSRPEKKADPDSPFAILAALKDKK